MALSYSSFPAYPARRQRIAMELQVFLHIVTILLCHFVDHASNLPAPPSKSTSSLACGNRPMVGYDVGSRIVGGKDAASGSWPWLVSIQRPIDESTFQQLCGATVLTTKWIMTAAHCFRNKGDSFYSWRLVFGLHKLSVLGSEVQIRKIAKKIQHEKYDTESQRNDIALLYLDKPISYNKYIQPACLPKKTADVSLMTDCFIAGWGVLKENDLEASETLQEAAVQMIPPQRCNSSSWYDGLVGIYNLCAGYEKGGIDSCQGDSGGPLMCKEPRNKIYSVVGVTSWGSGCAQAKSPGIYSSTQFFLSWILEKVETDPASRKSIGFS
ncbi:acrosin-like [Engystomops pustulosus]